MNFITILIIAIVFQPFGIAFKVLGQIGKIHEQYPKLTPKQCRQFYWQEDWNTILVSALLWVLQIVVQILLHYNGYSYLEGLRGMLIMMGGSLLLGYGGHVLIYRAFGTAMKKAEAFNDKIANTQSSTTVVETPSQTIVQQTSITPKEDDKP